MVSRFVAVPAIILVTGLALFFSPVTVPGRWVALAMGTVAVWVVVMSVVRAVSRAIVRGSAQLDRLLSDD